MRLRKERPYGRGPADEGQKDDEGTVVGQG